MRLSRVALFLVLSCLLGVAPATAQNLLIKAGPSFISGQTAGVDPSVQPGVQIGSQFWLAEFFQIQGLVGYNNLVTTEVSLYLRPFRRSLVLEPYTFIGYGRYFGGENERSIVPIGVGVEYDVNSQVGVSFEVSGRWSLYKNGVDDLQELDFGFFPALGVNYKFARAARFKPTSALEERERSQQEVTERTSPPVEDRPVVSTTTQRGTERPAPVNTTTVQGGGTVPQVQAPPTTGQLGTAPVAQAPQTVGQLGTAPTPPTPQVSGQPVAAPRNVMPNQTSGTLGQAQVTTGGAIQGATSQGTIGMTAADQELAAGAARPVGAQIVGDRTVMPGEATGSFQVPGAAAVIAVGEAQGSYTVPGVIALPVASVTGQAGDMVLVPDGTYTMGLFDQDPLGLQNQGFKRVTVSSFFIDKFETTNKQYRDWLATLPPSERRAMQPDSAAWEAAGGRSNFPSYFYGQPYDDYPVVAVNWSQATAYCEAQGKRLPTEAEWEYVARSGVSGGMYPWPGQSPQAPSGGYYANYNPGRVGYAADGYAFTAPVGAFPSSPWGIYNMSGNAAEWVIDTFNPTYSVLSDFNPRYENDSESQKLVRGGSWADTDFYIGVGVRTPKDANMADIFTGFRCVRDLGALDTVRPTPSGGQ